MKRRSVNIPSVLLLLGISLTACQNNQQTAVVTDKKDTVSCMKVPDRFAATDTSAANIKSSGDTSTAGMVLIPAGVFAMGADNDQASNDEYPKHWVRVMSFWMDATEVTNAQFARFVAATGYITVAERKPDWEELKKQLPPGTPKPSDDQLMPASLVFKPTSGPVDLRNYNTWWEWKKGADWKHPEGPGSSITGRDNDPVVQVSWDDAQAYCKWAGKRLPTEAEWEYAARGGLLNNIYPWGNEHVNSGSPHTNSWEGNFPYLNLKKDGFMTMAPVKSYAPNRYGLYDMAGNVWEWCADWYDAGYYQTIAKDTVLNPQGPTTSNDPEEPGMPKRVLRGGSFLCNDAYCSGYRVARRMKSTPDTGLEHTGFRCVRNK